MKPIFHIAPDSISDDDVLLCEISPYAVCTAWAHRETKQLKSASYYELRHILEPERLYDIIRTEHGSRQKGNQVIVSSAFQNALLVPASQYREDVARELYAGLNGPGSDELFFDDVQNYNAVVVHAVPQDLMEVLKNFNVDAPVHAYGCSLKTAGKNAGESWMHVHVSGREMQLIAVKENQLKLAQAFFYTAPLDVVYYLLLFCQEHGLPQSTPLKLSGLIHEDSALYKELYQYFANLAFHNPHSKSIPESAYPVHYFSSLYNLAACAS